MLDKVKLPKNVAAAIEEVREVYKAGIEYDLKFIEMEQTPIVKGLQVIHDFTEESRENMALYFQALVNGYEVEETPEDRVREYFNKEKKLCVGDQDVSHRVIQNVLDMLNIKIEGVNT